MRTLIHRAKVICDTESLQEELNHLIKTFKKNGYNNKDINRAFITKTKQETETAKDKPIGTALLPYLSATSHKIGRLLARHNIRTVHVPTKKTGHLLRPVKDDPGLQVPGVYCNPCECGKSYVGQTNRTIEARRKEHMRHFRLGQPEKSAVAQHAIDTGLFQNVYNHLTHFQVFKP
jgi:hypothetical protein